MASNEIPAEEPDSISQTFLDQMVSTDRGQMLKAAIPYLPPSGRRIVSLYTKAQEFANTVSLFSGNSNEVEICSAPAQDTDPLAMLQDIRRYCYGESRRNMDQIINMMALVQMMQIMRE